MSARVNVFSVKLLDNPLKLEDPFRIEIAFECFDELKEGVEWELVFVRTEGKMESDQTLDCVETGPLAAGCHKFTLESPPPEVSTLSADDLTDVTLLLLRCNYKEQLFVSIGWFVNHVYDDPQLLENPPEKPQVEKMTRHIVTGDVRVTTYAIKWGEDMEKPPESKEGEDEESEEEEDEEEDDEEEDESGEEMEQSGTADVTLNSTKPIENTCTAEEGTGSADHAENNTAEAAAGLRENSSHAEKETSPSVKAEPAGEPMPLADTTNS